MQMAIIKLATFKGKQRCHNTKVELWFQLWHCYADFELQIGLHLKVDTAITS